MSLEAHPLAELIPAMDEDAYLALREDIEANGLSVPIMLFEGKVLDGRHRARVCEELGIEPGTQEYDGGAPARLVLSMNVHRRHLTTAQKALIAKTAMPHFRETAKERQRSHGGTAPGRPAHTSGNPSTSGHERARDEAAALVGITGRTVGSLERVERDAPDLYEKVERGEMTVTGAEREVRRREQNPDSPAPAPKRQRMLENAHRTKLDSAITKLGGLASALAQFDLRHALEGADAETLAYWRKTAKDASRGLNDFRRQLETAQ